MIVGRVATSYQRVIPMLLALVALAVGASAGTARDERRQAPPADVCRGRAVAGVVDAVRDGDTIVVAGCVVRLWGLHAPELHEPGGAAARRWMVERAGDRYVVCQSVGRRSHDRLVAHCHSGEGDLAAQLIAAGLGRDCPRFSQGHYAAWEIEAGRRLPLPGYCLAATAGR
jgi:endonuclease YncB( thermonuclease family)